ncbi:transposase family protein [Aneurinibacillus sp. Ricciae_BoGa-3]|uniref:transposase family protein n=1 Tax=Aneurinibacillus sp. Ricciae_BoGa-3 TaxID=3022697 RepID=UPI0023404A9C|nr:transposase family protein [Aneurinibacillus sp. Ricciae_BoGa-3]WCK56853.1 transposase family protein [Aneurinibacillus sp. Ricciae_BoGa-3]
MLSIPLELPEFQIVNQWSEKEAHFALVRKQCGIERCPACGFCSLGIHDRRTRKLRDLAVLKKPLFLLVEIVRFRCKNCEDVFSQSFDSIKPNQHFTKRY